MPSRDLGRVSDAERADFVEAVLARKIEPDFAAVAYHFAGWLDQGVVEAVFEVSTDSTDAVSALASMCLPAAVGDDNGANRTATGVPGNSWAASTAASEDATYTASADKRHATTLEAMQAQRASSAPTDVGPATPNVDDDGVEVAAVAVEEVEEEERGEEEEEGKSTPAATSDNGSSAASVELEKVAAFIASYGNADRAFSEGEVPSVPSTRRMQLVIANTAEKTVELPGFEAFMKMQHGKDALFGFLAANHALHSYYLLAKRHVQDTVMRGVKPKALAPPPYTAPPVKVDVPTGDPVDPDVAEIIRMLGGLGP